MLSWQVLVPSPRLGRVQSLSINQSTFIFKVIRFQRSGMCVLFIYFCFMFPQKFKKILSKKNKNDPVTPSALVLPPHLHWNTASVWGDGLHPPTVKIPVTNRQTERLYWRAIFIMKQYWDQIETVVTWWLIPPLWSLPCPPPSWHAPCTAHLSSDAVKWTRYFHFSWLPPKARAIVSSNPCSPMMSSPSVRQSLGCRRTSRTHA